MERNTESLRTSIASPGPDNSSLTVLDALAQGGQQIVEADQHAKIANAVSQAQMDITQQSQQYRVDNADDPLGGLQELKENRQAILDQYGSQISPFFGRDWQAQARELSTRQDVSNEEWAYKQLKVNTVRNINNSMQTGFQQANIDGQNYATGDATLGDALSNFATQKSKIQQFGASNIGDDRTEQLMKTHDKDYMKSFVAGVAETNPQKAAALLQDPNIKDEFTTQERGEFADVIQKTQKQQELTQSLQITQNTQQVTSLVNDPNQTYFNKRLTIDKMEQQGAISTQAAANARRVLTSQKDVDAVTNSGEMADVIQKIYDLNSSQSMNNSDYLSGAQDIHNLILQKQSQGLINGQDVIKLNNEMQTLTAKHVADATKAVGNDMSDATDQFQQLPPEYRGDATRQLFYATAGQHDSMTDDQFQTLAKNSATKIVNQINQQRRTSALQAVNSIKNVQPGDLDLLKSKGYTIQDVQETAQKYKLTPQQVIKKLKAKQ